MTTYIKDLIDLPEKVHGGDFVLKLTEGVEHPEQTLKPYVVTPQLGECFDAASVAPFFELGVTVLA